MDNYLTQQLRLLAGKQMQEREILDAIIAYVTRPGTAAPEPTPPTRSPDDFITREGYVIPAPAPESSEPQSVSQVTDPTLPPPSNASNRLIPWGATVERDFLLSVLWIEEQLGLKTEFVMACMKFESNLNPAAKNPYSSGSGLIQFMENTAQRLGTSTAKLRSMTAIRQLTYVYKYFKEYKDRGFKLHQWSLEDTYMSILWPAGIGKPSDYHVFVDDPAKLKDAYDVNKGLDANKDGFITKAEACAKVVKLYDLGLAAGNVGTL